jgi:hypothetical protein
MDKIKKDMNIFNEKEIDEEEFGLILSKLENIEEFLKGYKSMMK